MKVTIKKILIENFKGIKRLDINLGDKTIIKGRNASGKSTIATAITWCLTDKDINLTSNPAIFPLGVEECSPTVTLTLDIDGKTVELTKMQVCKKSKPDAEGVIKTSMNNTYLWNSCPITERDFKSKLEGILNEEQ